MSLWAKVITGIHNLKNKPADFLAKKNITSVWKNIVGVKNEIETMGIRFNDIFKQIVKMGNKTQFWHDLWVGAEKLKVMYPRLYKLDRKK